MPVSEIKPGGAGFGQRRFIIRGSGFLVESRERILRPTINEYPERFPIYVDFPSAGYRRGSSPARRVAGEGGEGAPSSPLMPAPNYPTPRVRVDDIPVSALPMPDSPDATVTRRCVDEGGVSINRGVDVAAGVTTVSVIGPIPRPFVIRYVEMWAGGSDTARSNIGVRVASDRVATGGFDTSGVPLGLDISGDVDFSGHGQMHRTYPNFVWTTTPAFIKFIVFNNTAGSLFYHLVVSLEWLN